MFSTSQPRQEQDITSDQSSRSSSEYLLLYFGKDSSDVQVRPLWYRGDSRSPTDIFKKGFTARGTSLDVFSHVNPIGEQWFYDSSYVATSTSKYEAAQFPKDAFQAFVYEINQHKNAIDVSSHLYDAVKKKILHTEDASIMLQEREMAVPHRIDARNIKGAWPVRVSMEDLSFIRIISKEYIPNPHYANTIASKILQTAKVTGHGLTGAGVLLDGASLYETYESSKATGDYNLFFREGSRILGGWSGAIALGTKSAKMGAAIGRIGGPIGMAAGAVVGGLAGSIMGYKTGEMLGEEGYDFSTINEAEALEANDCTEVPIRVYQVPEDENAVIDITSSMELERQAQSEIFSGTADHSEKEKLLKQHKGKKISQASLKKNHQVLQEIGLPTQFSENKEENNVMHIEFASIISQFEKQAAEKEELLKIEAINNTFKAVDQLGKTFGMRGLQEFAFVGLQTWAIGSNLQKLGIHFAAPIGISILNPISLAFTAGLSLFGFLNSDDNDELADQRLAEFNVIRAMLQSIYDFLIEHAQYSHMRFNRLEWQSYQYFSQIMEVLKILNEIFSSGFQYTKQRLALLNSKITTILTIVQEHSLERLYEAESILERNKVLSSSEFLQILSVTEFYLHKQAANTAFTNTLITTMNKRFKADAFRPENIEHVLLNEDPFNKIGFLSHLLNHLLGRNPEEIDSIANPYIFLKAIDIHLKTLLRFPDRMTEIPADKITKLCAPAKAVIDLCQLARENSNLFLSNYERAKENLNNYLLEQLKLFNANNTPEGIDIHGNMTSLLPRYTHRGTSILSNATYPQGLITDGPFLPLKQFATITSPHLDSWRRVSPTTQLNITQMYLDIANTQRMIPAVLMLGDRTGKGSINANFKADFIGSSCSVQFKFNVFFAHPNKTETPIFETTQWGNGYCDGGTYPNLYNVGFIPTSEAGMTAELQKGYYKIKGIGHYEKLYDDNNLILFEDELNKKILIDAIKDFAKKLESSPEFRKHVDILNAEYITLMSYLSISFDKLVIPSHSVMNVPILYNGYDIDELFKRLQVQANLADLDFILQKEWQPQYQIFKASLKQARIHPLESTLQTVLTYYNSINSFLALKKIHSKPLKFSNRLKHENSKIKYLHDAVGTCDEQVALTAILDTSDLNAMNEQDESPIDLSLKCKDTRKRNRLLMHLVENRAYACADPDNVANLLVDILDKSRDFISEADFHKLERSYHRFCQYHNIKSSEEYESLGFSRTPLDPLEQSFSNSAPTPLSMPFWMKPVGWIGSALSATFAGAKIAGSTAAKLAGNALGFASDTVSYIAGNSHPEIIREEPKSTLYESKEEKARSDTRDAGSKTPRSVTMPAEVFRVTPSHPIPPKISTVEIAQVAIPLVSGLCKEYGLFGHTPLASKLAEQNEMQHEEQLEEIEKYLDEMKDRPTIGRRSEYHAAREAFELAELRFKNHFLDPEHKVTKSENFEVVQLIDRAQKALTVADSLQIEMDEKHPGLDESILSIEEQQKNIYVTLRKLIKSFDIKIKEFNKQQDLISEKLNKDGISKSIEEKLNAEWDKLEDRIAKTKNEKDIMQEAIDAITFLLDRNADILQAGCLGDQIKSIKESLDIIELAVKEMQLATGSDFVKRGVVSKLITIVDSLREEDQAIDRLNFEILQPATSSMGIFSTVSQLAASVFSRSSPSLPVSTKPLLSR